MNNHRQFAKVSALGLVLASLCAAGCGGSQPPPAPPPPPAPAASAAATTPVVASAAAPAPAASDAPGTAPAPSSAPAAEEHHGHHHGMASMISESLASLTLSPEQKTTVADIEKQMATLDEEPKEARDTLVKDVADGVAAGKIDKKKTDADIKALSDAAGAKTTSAQDAMNRLHKALDPAQRKQFVEKMRAEGEEMKAHMMEHGAGHEHGEKGEKGPGHEGEHGEGHMHGHAEKMAEELGLTPEQKEKLHTKMESEMKANGPKMKAKMEAMHGHMKAVGEAFEKDDFDAKKAGVGEHGAEMAKDMAERRVKMAEGVMSVLTPEQRTKFAEHVRAHAEGPDDDD